MYTREQTIAMLEDAAVLITEDGAYRIGWIDNEEGIVYLTDEDDGDEVAMPKKDIDLSQPDVLLYKLTLMNGATDA